MRVVLFTDTLGDVNGVSRFVRTLARYALTRGHDLHVVTSTRKPVPDLPTIHNLPPTWRVPLPLYRELDLVSPPRGAVRRLVERLAPGAIHVSTPGPVGLLGRALALRMGVRLVGTHHTDFGAYADRLCPVPGAGAAARGILGWFYAPFDAVLTRSPASRQDVVALGVDASRVGTIVPGIDLDEFCPGPTRERARGRVTALYAGRVSVEKNLPMLARIWPGVRDACAVRGVNATLRVVGDGPWRGAMERALRGAGARFDGVLLGAALVDAYRSAHALLFPSVTDTLGQTVMEAQACGLPAVVSDAGGPATIVRAGVSGLVVPAGDERAWTSACADLLCDEPLRRAMGDAAARHMLGMGFDHTLRSFWASHEPEAPVRDPRAQGRHAISLAGAPGS